MVVVYFSWVLGVGVWAVMCALRRQFAKGLWLILLGASLQVFALIIHIEESVRVHGTTDSLYTWILPLLIASLGTVLWLIGACIAIWSKRKTGESD